MGKKDGRYGFINPLAAARAKDPAPSMRTSTEDYLKRPRLSLDDAMDKLRSDKSTLEQWEIKMNEGFRQSLEKDRGKRLADSQAKASQKAAARAKADVLQRAIGMLRHTDGTMNPSDMTKEKTLGKDKIPTTTIFKTVKSTKVTAPLVPVIEMMSKGKLPTTTIVQAVKPSAKPAPTGPSLADLDERTLRKALKKATSAVTSAGPTTATSSEALASFEKELERRRKEKKKSRRHKKKHSKRRRRSSGSASSLSSSSSPSSSSSSSSVDSDSEAEPLADRGVGDELNAGSEGSRRLGRRSERRGHKRKRRGRSPSLSSGSGSDSESADSRHRHSDRPKRKRKRRHRSRSSHSGSESGVDSDGSTSAQRQRHHHRKHKKKKTTKKKKHNRGRRRLDDPAPGHDIIVVSDASTGQQDAEDGEEVWTEVTAPASAVSIPPASGSPRQRASSSSRHHRKHHSKRKRRRGQSDSDG